MSSKPKSMKLTFKGDKKTKSSSSSSKRHRSASPGDDGEGSSKRKSSRRSKAVDEDEEEGEPGDWVFPELAGEVNGPTFLWAPSDPPCCISFDAQRSRVVPFPLPAAPRAEPAASSSSAAPPSLPPALAYEPAEIAHVWVVSQLSGSSAVNLRTASGKFLACDRFGVVTADSESRGPLESFTVHVLSGGSGSVALETTHGTFLSISPTASSGPTLRGDSTSIGFSESFHAKVQRSFRTKARRLASDAEEKGGRRTRDEDIDEEKLTKDRVSWFGNKHIKSTESKVELRKAQKEGRLSEALLDRRTKLKSDKFC